MSTVTRQGLGTATTGGAATLHEWLRVPSPDAYIGYHNSVIFTDGLPDKTVRISGHIGPGLTPTTLNLIVVSTGTGNIRWSANYDYGAEGTEVYNATTGVIAATTSAVTINILSRIALAIPGITAADVLGFEFTGDLDNVLNTVSYHVLGICIS